MKRKFGLVLTTLLLISVMTTSIGYIASDFKNPPDGFFFGVSFGLQTANEAKSLIDKVKTYTNFFVVNSWDISTNETALNEVCNYAAKNGLSFIVFFDYISLDFMGHEEHGFPWHHGWVYTAKEKWGEKFLGIYIYEEPGGKQIDTGLFDEFFHESERAKVFENVTTYSEAAEVFVNELPKGWSFHYLQNLNIKRFVSDYALYWFDYLAGYSTVFVELGWNQSSIKHIGLCRGAARTQEKDWGAIITWTFENPPYLESGPKIFDEMVTAYEAGAKYIVVFNFPTYPLDNQFGILSDEHFSAMQKFWNYIKRFPKEYGKTEGQVSFVLPKDYGWGMRSPNDNIWLPRWGPDGLSPQIWENLNKLIEDYGLQLDIIYDDPRFIFEGYRQVYYWNDTIT